MDINKSDIEWLVTIIVMIIIGRPVTININCYFQVEKQKSRKKRKHRKHKKGKRK